MRKAILKGFLMIAGVCLLMAVYFSQRSVEGAGTCHTEACQACRNAGYTQADDSCSWKYQQIRYENARERFCYRGAPEGHDCRANLLNAAACKKIDICNYEGGWCSGTDLGCDPLSCPIPPIVCGGDPENETCSIDEHCVGEWKRNENGPFALWSSHTSFTTYSPFRPWDCDCKSAHGGNYASIKTKAYQGDFEGPPVKTSLQQCVGTKDCDPNTWCYQQCLSHPDNAGCIYNRGWDGAVKVFTGYYCAYEDIYEGCIFLGIEDVSYRSRSLYSGNPNWHYWYGSCP